MKTILGFVAVLAVIATFTDSSVIKTEISGRANLVVGSISSSDRTLYSTYISRAAIPNAIQYQDVVYRGNTTTRISAVRAYEVGATQFANATIIQGGIGQSNITIRFTSSRGRGYYYQLQIYGR